MSSKFLPQGTIPGPLGPMTVAPHATDDYLFAERGPAMGRGFRLTKTPVRIGRTPGLEIVLDDRHVSRLHAQLVRSADGAWAFQDLASGNGSFVEKVRAVAYQSSALANGTRLSVGESVLRFVSRSSPEAAVNQLEIEQTTIDPATGLPTRIAALDELRRRVHEAQLASQPLAVVVFAIKHFDQLKMLPGDVATFAVKRTAAAVVELAAEQGYVARIAEAHLLLVMPGAISEQARGFARGLLHRFLDPSSGGGVCIELAAGIASLGEDRGAADLLVLAETAALSAATRSGDMVDVDQAGRTSIPRVVREGYFLVRQLVAQGGGHGLVAIELADERELLQDERLGASAVRRMLEELIEDAMNQTSDDVELGMWRDHYLLLGIPSARFEDVDGIVDSVARAFASRPELFGARGAASRSTRWAGIDAATLRDRSENALNALVRDLAARNAASADAASSELPHPFVVLSVQRAARTTAYGRLKITLDAIETSLRFLVASELGWLLAHGDASQMAIAGKVIREVGPKSLSMGNWEKLAFQLARVLPATHDHPIVRSARSLLRKDGSPSVLAAKIRETVELRNKDIGHGVGLDENAYGKQERDVALTFEQLTAALAPFRETELVSVVEIHSLADEDDDEAGNEYALRVLQGPIEVFRIERRTLGAKLKKDWAYLLHSRHEPIALAPLALVQTCEHCRRVELFLAEHVPVGPKGAQVWLRGIATNHAFATGLPWSKSLGRLHDEVTKAGG